MQQVSVVTRTRRFPFGVFWTPFGAVHWATRPLLAGSMVVNPGLIRADKILLATKMGLVLG